MTQFRCLGLRVDGEGNGENSDLENPLECVCKAFYISSR